MHRAIVKYLVFPGIESLYGRPTMRLFREAEAVQWCRPSEIRELQFRKLEKLLNHAYTNIPYYREKFSKMRLSPKDLKSIDDLNKFPFLTKEDVRINIDRLTTEQTRQHCRKIFTGGSTGIPLAMYMDGKRQSSDLVSMTIFYKWWGVDIGDRQAIIWGWPNEFVVPRIKKILFNRVYMSAFDMSEEKMLSFYKKLLKFKPKMLFGYATSIYAFAKFLKYKNLYANDINVKIVVTTGDVLYDNIRKFISSVFGCEVADHYGARDGGIIAGECPSGNMHIHAGGVFLEEINSELIVTHLENYSMPFIRYKIGDRGTISYQLCECKRGLPVLNSLEGRTNDILMTPSGKLVHGLLLAYTIKDYKGIRQFKVIQETKDRLLVMIKKEKSFLSNDLVHIRNKLQNVMGNDVNIFFEFTDKLPQEDPRKLRYVVSKVKQNNN